MIDGLVAAFQDGGGNRTAISLSSAGGASNGYGGNTVSIGASGVVRASNIAVS